MAVVSRYKDFKRKICAYRQRDLLPVVARIGSQYGKAGPFDLDSTPGADTVVTPWALAAIARESIVSGSDGARPHAVTDRDVRRLCSVYANLEDPLIREGPDADLTGFFVRLGFEQFASQMSQGEEVARTLLFYLTAAADVPSATLLSEQAWERALGVPLQDFLAVGFFMHIWSILHEGWVDLSWLALPQFAPILGALDERRIRDSVERYLAAGFATFRALDRTAFREPGLLEHRFNPLEARPLFKLEGKLIAPSPSLLLGRISATGIYYDRCKEPGFTDQLGPVFEHYVGIHLKMIPNATVLPEIEYARSQRTVDWIVVFDELVVLVEVKAARLTERARAGVPDALAADIDRTLVRAHSQIENTARLLRDGHPALDSIPTDRPVMGLTVTLEPFWLLGTELTPLPKPDGAVVPVVVASARDIENAAAWSLKHDAGKLLRALFDDGKTGTRALTSLPGGSDLRNPLLEASWDRVHVWLDVAREIEERSGPRRAD